MKDLPSTDAGLKKIPTAGNKHAVPENLFKPESIRNTPITESITSAGSNVNTGNSSPNPPSLSDAAGWNKPQFYSTIQYADIDGDGQAELLARSSGGIMVWKFTDIDDLWNQLPNGPGFSDENGWGLPRFYSTIQCADIDGDGQDELLARSAGGIVVYKFNTITQNWNELEGVPAFSDNNGWGQPQFYTTIQCADIDGDGRAELLARGAGGMVIYQYNTHKKNWDELPNGPGFSDANGWGQPQFYTTIQFADIDGDQQAELIARSASGIVVYKCDRISFQWNQLPNGPALSDESGWNQPQFYTTIACADIDGDGHAELLARSVGGMIIYKYNAQSQNWNQLPNGPGLNDISGWNNPQYYTTIQYADVDADGQLELLARGAAGMSVFKCDKTTFHWSQLSNGPGFSDASGWDQPQFYTTIECADINGDGQAEMLARSAGGIVVYADDKVRNNGWEPFPTLGPIPQPTAENLASVTQSLVNMNAFVDQYHDFFQDTITTLYLLSQVSDTDPGQSFANNIISLAFQGIGAAPVPGAGAISGVLGGIFTYVSTHDPRGDLNVPFINVLLRFNRNLLDTKWQIGVYNSNLATNWKTALINQATGQTMVLADLVNYPFPASATEPFNTLLLKALASGKAALWKEVIPQRWNKVSLINPLDLSFRTEQECRNWIQSYVNTNPGYYITYYEGDATWPAKGKRWRVKEWWMGYGFFPYGHHEAPQLLCNELFTDDGLGNVVRPLAITTRADVFENWSLPIQEVVMPGNINGMPIGIRAALTIAQIQNTPVQLANQDLTGVIMQQASLQKADLSNITAYTAQLAKSDLREATMTNAILCDADLSYTKLQNARLHGADLTNASLQFADASGADLGEAILTDALALSIRAANARLSKAVLKGALLRGANLSNADLSHADLSGADLAGACLKNANLNGANLTNAILRGADLTGADLTNTKLEGIDNIFSTGIPGNMATKTTRAVRCLAQASSTPFDADTFMKVSRSIANLLDVTLPQTYGQMVENFGAAIGTFAAFGIPLTEPGKGLTLTFGTGGNTFYTQVAQQMNTLGVNTERINLLGQLGSTAGYCPLGFRSNLINAGQDINAALQGPAGLQEVNTLLDQAGAGYMKPLVQSASNALGVSNVMLTSIDFSPAQPYRTEVCFAVNPGDAAAFSNLLSTLRITWPEAANITQWLARTQTPYLVTVGTIEGNSNPEIGVYLPNNPDRNADVDTLLDTYGIDLFDNIEILTTTYPLTLAYITILRAPDGNVNVAAQVAFD